MADKVALGKAFMAELLARIPEDQRAGVQTALEADEVVGFLGEGTLRQSDYSRNMNDLSAKHQELTVWYDTNKAALEAATRGRTGDPAPTPTALDMKAVEKFVAERERGVGAFVVATNDLAMKHYKEFGEPLNLSELLADPTVEKVGLLGVYDAKYAPKYQEKRDAAKKAEIDTAVAAGIAEARKSFTSAPPYPTSPMDLSPLDVLEPNKGADAHSAQAAADEYTRLVNLKQSGVGA